LKQEAASLLDKVALAGAQEKIQDTLEAERDEFLEREWYVRAGKTKPRGYRNGFAKPRTVHLGGGSVAVEMPRVRDDGGDFQSGLLAPYQRTSPKVLETLPDLYLYGISTGDFEAASECLLGVGAALSPSTISRLKEKWAEEYEAWRKRPLASHYAYIWADGIYIKVGRNKEKLALLVVMGADVDGRKQLLTLIAGQRESTEQWLGKRKRGTLPQFPVRSASRTTRDERPGTGTLFRGASGHLGRFRPPTRVVHRTVVHRCIVQRLTLAAAAPVGQCR
jgi:putative transposase